MKIVRAKGETNYQTDSEKDRIRVHDHQSCLEEADTSMRYAFLGNTGLRVSELALGGALTGKYIGNGAGNNSGGTGRLEVASEGYFGANATERANAIVQVAADTAKEIGCSPAQLMLALLSSQSPRHIPIVRARSLDHLKDNLDSANVELDDEVVVARLPAQVLRHAERRLARRREERAGYAACARWDGRP